MTGRLIIKRYKYTTVFLDQVSRLGCDYTQKTNNVIETLKAKAALRPHSLEIVIIIKYYHTDNSIFKAHDRKQACKNERQKLTFAEVNAHFTNGLAEKRVRDLQDLAQTEPIYSSTKWKGCITSNLWPYEMRIANEILNNSSSPEESAMITPEQISSKTLQTICVPSIRT